MKKEEGLRVEDGREGAESCTTKPETPPEAPMDAFPFEIRHFLFHPRK